MFHSTFCGYLSLLFLGFYLVHTSNAIKCYICGNEEVEESLPCSKFETEDPRFSQDCENDKSCKITRRVSDNNILSRSCELNKLDDCQTANSIMYCYCFKDYCNKIIPSDEEDEIPEDIIEGSGKGHSEGKGADKNTNIFSNISTATVSSSEFQNKTLGLSNQKTTSGCVSLKTNCFLISLYFIYLIFATIVFTT